MIIKSKKIMEVNVPNKLIFKRNIYEIMNIHRKFVIKGYEIKTVDEKIDTVTLNTPHPNANPRTGEFCIPNNMRNLKLNENSLKMIRTMLCCFNLDDCYFAPWDEIEYQKTEVSGTWKTRKIN